MTVNLRWVALGLAVLAMAVLFVPVAADSGAFAIWGLGLPVVLCVVPVVTASSRYSGAVTGAVAALLLVWAVLLALGIGMFLLPAAFAELAAAAWQPRPGRVRT